MARLSRLPWLGPRVAIRLHRAGLGAATMRWDDLAALVEAERPATLSVDVFDTCLVRNLVGDGSIEFAIDHHLLVARSGDPRSVPADTDRGSTGRRVAVADALEAHLCRPVPGVADSLDRIRSAGTTITFLSDTERSSVGLEYILRQTGLFVDGDKLVVSCEAGATKSTGALFDLMWGQASTERSAPVWHVGNCRWSDLTMANKAGLRAHTIDWAEPTRYEEAMASRPGTAGPAIAGAARTHRLATEHHGGPAGTTDPGLHVMGGQVAGQAFGAFLLWLAEEARASEIDQLWFLSRDGELLSLMAEAMPGDHWDGITRGYLHCSRWSWFLAGAASYGLAHWLAAGTADESSFIHTHRHQVSLRSLLGRIGLDPEDLDHHRGLARLPPDGPLPVGAVDQWEALLADPVIHAVIEERARVRHDLIVDHLAGLGLAPGHAGLVDVGWRGRLAWAMSPILEEVTGYPPIHFHFGGNQVLDDADAAVDIRRFAFQPNLDYPIANPVACVETFTASGRARVVDYERDATGEVVPVFDRHMQEVDNADRRTMWAGAVDCARHLPSRAELDRLGVGADSLADEAVEVLNRWWNRPDPAEVAVMRGLAFEDDDDGQATRPLITPYSFRELASDTRRPRLWQQGSAAASPPMVGLAARLGRWLQNRRNSGSLFLTAGPWLAGVGHHALAGLTNGLV